MICSKNKVILKRDLYRVRSYLITYDNKKLLKKHFIPVWSSLEVVVVDFVCKSSRPKVNDLYHIFFSISKHNIFWLQIAMNDSTICKLISVFYFFIV